MQIQTWCISDDLSIFEPMDSVIKGKQLINERGGDGWQAKGEERQRKN